MKLLLVIVSSLLLSFGLKASNQEKAFTIKIKVDVKGKGGTVAGSGGTTICPNEATAVCHTITLEVQIGGSMALQPGDIIPLAGQEGELTLEDGGIQNVLILAPTNINVGEDGEVNIQGSDLFLQFNP